MRGKLYILKYDMYDGFEYKLFNQIENTHIFLEMMHSSVLFQLH